MASKDQIRSADKIRSNKKEMGNTDVFKPDLVASHTNDKRGSPDQSWPKMANNFSAVMGFTR